MRIKELDNKIESATDNHSEATIIDIRDFVQYQKELSEVMESVNDLSEIIYGNLFSLASLGKWKEWDAKQPVGTEFYVTEDMLRNTGDKNIDLLWEILDKITEVKGVIQVTKQSKNKHSQTT